jgi:hypothetical protein
MSENAVTITTADEIPKCPSEEIILPIAGGSWRIPRKLSHSLAAMFFSANGFRCDQRTLDVFVSAIVESEVASFRLLHRDELMKSYGRPPMKPTDSTREIKEVCE